jgi:hypothetical protein
MLRCSKCKEEKLEELFYKSKATKTGYQNQCKECQYLGTKEPKRLENRREYSRNRRKPIELQREHWNQYYRRNKAHVHARNAERRAKRLQATPSWANNNYIKLFYEMALLETERIGVKVTVDHIVPLKHNLVCGLHCEDNLQLLTHSENSRKNNQFTII